MTSTKTGDTDLDNNGCKDNDNDCDGTPRGKDKDDNDPNTSITYDSEGRAGLWSHYIDYFQNTYGSATTDIQMGVQVEEIKQLVTDYYLGNISADVFNAQMQSYLDGEMATQNAFLLNRSLIVR